MATAQVSEQLWDEFHTAVNMTSAELQQWLLTEASDENTEPVTEADEPPLGRQVVHILGKRRTDLTADDVRAMERVVAIVRRERGADADGIDLADLEPEAGNARWRRRLMRLGHDPLKPRR